MVKIATPQREKRAPGICDLRFFESGVKLTWPIVDMTKDPTTGDWSYTTPLPSAVFDYQFIVNCTHPELTPVQLADPNLPAGYMGCPEVANPSNPPWNQHHGTTRGSVVTYSEVYVPADPAFHTDDYSWEAPTSPQGDAPQAGREHG